MSTQGTYFSYPQVLDFGSITLGQSLIQQVRIQYNLAPSQSVGGVLTSQTSITGEVFAIDDGGSNAEEFITLSTDNVNFYNRVNISSFPATEPPNFITLYVNVNPDQTKVSTTGDFIVYLKSVQVPSFSVPIHFRIVNGLYLSAGDVRQSMGDFGRQRVDIYAFHDLFTDPTAPLWTNASGTWNQASNINGVRQGANSQNPNTQAVSTTTIQDFGDYNVSVWATTTSVGEAGIVFAYSSTSNYYRAYISTSAGKAICDQVINGVITTLFSVSAGGTTSISQSLSNNSPINLRVEKHPTTADFFVGEQKVGTAVGLILTGSPGLFVGTGGGPTEVNFQEYHVSESVYQFDDASINAAIQEEQEFIEQRIGRVYGAQTVTELLDWNDRQPIRMPYIPARSFNMLPTGTALSGSGQDQRVFSLYEPSIYLRQRPVISVVLLEEDINTDGQTPNWTLRTQGRGGDYIVYPELGKIVFFNNLPNNGHQNIKVIYNVGFAKIPAYIKGYLKEKVALRLLENLGTSADGIKEMVAKKEANMARYEEYIPQKTIIYAVGSKQPLY